MFEWFENLNRQGLGGTPIMESKLNIYSSLVQHNYVITVINYCA